MLKNFIILFLSLISSISWAAVGDKNFFDQATVLYKQGQFEQALEMYAKITDKDHNVAFNQGNCAFKLQRYGQALLFWRRAERDWGFSNRQELSDNIALVKKVTTPISKQKVDQSPWSVVQSSTRDVKNTTLSFVRATPLFYFQLLFLILWLMFFALLKWLKRQRRGAVVVFVAIIYASAGLLLVSKYSMNCRNYGVVTVKKANLYSGPGESYQVLGSLLETQEVIIQRESDGYYKIKASPLFGWVAKDGIGII